MNEALFNLVEHTNRNVFLTGKEENQKPLLRRKVVFMRFWMKF